jgi:predicted secreted Zn-dependent protease
MLDRIDGRLAFMKTELKIADAQAAAWDELAKVIRNNAETHNAMMREMMKDVRSGSLLETPLPERLTIQQTHMEARLEQIKAVKAAVYKRYALLDDT